MLPPPPEKKDWQSLPRPQPDNAQIEGATFLEVLSFNVVQSGRKLALSALATIFFGSWRVF